MSGTWFNGKKVEETDFSAGTFDASGQKFTPTSGSIAASTISITDVGGYYTATDVEGALQEVGLNVSVLPNKPFVIAMGVAL